MTLKSVSRKKRNSFVNWLHYRVEKLTGFPERDTHRDAIALTSPKAGHEPVDTKLIDSFLNLQRIMKEMGAEPAEIDSRLGKISTCLTLYGGSLRQIIQSDWINLINSKNHVITMSENTEDENSCNGLVFSNPDPEVTYVLCYVQDCGYYILETQDDPEFDVGNFAKGLFHARDKDKYITEVGSRHSFCAAIGINGQITTFGGEDKSKQEGN